MLDGGERLPFVRAIVATGGENRRLPIPGADLDGVFDLRFAEDAERIAAAASASVTANFRSKNGLCIAVMTSGRTPSSDMNIRIDTGAAASSASASTNETRRGRCALSAASMLMS